MRFLLVVVLSFLLAGCGDRTDSPKAEKAAMEPLIDLEAAERKVEQNPTPVAYIDLSLHYYKAGEYEKSIEACRKALELDPAGSLGARLHAIAYNNICSAYNKLQEWDKAIDGCEIAVALDPSFQLARNNLAVAQGEKARSAAP